MRSFDHQMSVNSECNNKVSNPYLPNHNYQFIEGMRKTTKNIQ